MRHVHLLTCVVIILILFCKGQENESVQQQDSKNVQTKRAFTDSTACIFPQIAYCPEPQEQLQKYLPGWNVVWNALPIKGNHAFVAANGDSYVIAFRGSLINFTEMLLTTGYLMI